MIVSAKTKWILAGIGVFLVLVIAIQNIGQIQIRFLFWSASTDKLFLIPFLFLCGVVVGMILQWGIHRKPKSSAK
mgnify:FL=1